MKVIFIGFSGYQYPHVRVRCYNFARILKEKYGLECSVLSFRDHLAAQYTEVEMYEQLNDPIRLWLNLKALLKLLPKKDTFFYIQKAHFNAAAPFLWHRILKTPYIFDYDDYDIEQSVIFRRGILSRLFFGTNRWDKITYKLANQAKACVASNTFLKEILSCFNQRVEYVPTGVDTSIFTARETYNYSEPPSFLWTGLVWGEEIYNNVCFLLHCFAKVKQKCPSARLRIIGGGQWFKYLPKAIQEIVPYGGVDLQGWQDPDSIPDLLRQNDIGLLPLKGNSLWLKSKSPTKLFEFMAAGMPVVASGCGDVNYVIKNGESGFLANNEEEFTKYMLLLSQDTALREKIGRKARQRIENNYSLDILADRLYSLLQEVA